MKPLTMLEFVQESNDLEAIKKYAKFLSQKPEKWMFVPCDEFGFILERPNNYENWLKDARRAFKYTIGDNVINHNYRQALDRVIFEGFEVFGNMLYIPNLITIKLDKDGKTADFENLDKLFSEFPEYLTLKKPI